MAAAIKVHQQNMPGLSFAVGDDSKSSTVAIDAALQGKFLYGLVVNLFMNPASIEVSHVANYMVKITGGLGVFRLGDMIGVTYRFAPIPEQLTAGDLINVVASLNRPADGVFVLDADAYWYYADSNKGDLIPSEIIKSIY